MCPIRLCLWWPDTATGLRVGWTGVPQEMVRGLNKLSQNLYISVCSLAQHAAVAALRHAQDDVDAMVATYRERHDYLVAALRDLGFGVEVVPPGALDAWTEIKTSPKPKRFRDERG